MDGDSKQKAALQAFARGADMDGISWKPQKTITLENQSYMDHSVLFI